MSRKLRYRTARSIEGVQSLDEAKRVLEDVLYMASTFKTSTTADYTTTGKVSHETVVCKNTSGITVSLHSPASDGDTVTIIRQNTGTVSYDTEGSETINGAASASLASQYDKATLIFDEDSQDWN